MPFQKEEQKSSTSLTLPPTSFKLTRLISTVNISEFNGFIGLRLTGQMLCKAMWENNKDTNEAQTETELNPFTIQLFQIYTELHSLGLPEPFDQSLGCEGSQGQHRWAAMDAITTNLGAAAWRGWIWGTELWKARLPFEKAYLIFNRFLIIQENLRSHMQGNKSSI